MNATRRFLASLVLSLLAACAVFAGQPAPASADPSVLQLQSGSNRLELQFIASNVLRVHYEPNGASSSRTLVIDPRAHWPVSSGHVTPSARQLELATSAMTVRVSLNPMRISIYNAQGAKVLWEPPAGGAANGQVLFSFAGSPSFYGVENTSVPGAVADHVDVRQDIRNGLERNGGGTASAGMQGDGGAPLLYTTAFGILVDSDGGQFNFTSDGLTFTGSSRKDIEYFVILGDPYAIMRAVADISGHPPMMPKWSLGFLNSQWGSNENEVRQIVHEYRATKIPIDTFILDFDWKAWGEDNYGEWRWNSTHGSGNLQPDKFPDGASGAFAREMSGLGIKLAGIFKPRIVLEDPITGKIHEAAAYARDHNLFLIAPQQHGQIVWSRHAEQDVDFSKPLTRRWYWEHAIPAYSTGIVAFWNDEADVANSGLAKTPRFGFLLQAPNFQFLNMERAMYEGARSVSNRRVWSVNRNFYLGDQRYAYAEWSGDIPTGFESMREQSTRMLGSIDLGEPHWSMDTGGFAGHPGAENYARWMEFAAFVPVMRVHGTHAEKRQPWVYGTQAEADAKAAIELRYRLLPYTYSYEWQTHETGVGIVRPLFWEFPNDTSASNLTDEWMFGQQLLAAPVLGEGQAHRSVYLPAGTWYDYFRGTHYEGKRTIVYDVDPTTWADMPLFVRAGAIVPTQDVEQYVGERPITRVYLDAFPADSGSFTYYDDDGATYAYEKGDYYEQRLTMVRAANNAVHFEVGPPKGLFHPALQTYLLTLHGITAGNVRVNGAPASAFPTQKELLAAPTQVSGWATGSDRFGPATYILVAAQARTDIEAMP